MFSIAFQNTKRCKQSIKETPDKTAPVVRAPVKKAKGDAKKMQHKSAELKSDSNVIKGPEIAKRKTRKSGGNQSGNLADELPDTSGNFTRKRRLRSVDKTEQQLPSDGLERLSPSKKLKRSSNKKSDKSPPAPSVKDTKNQKAQKGSKETKEAKENAKTVVNKAQKKSPEKMTLVKTDKPKQEANSATRSTPKSLYDFTADSPKTLDCDSAENVNEKQTKMIPKATKRQKQADRKTRLRNRVDPSLITPKTKRCRVVLSPVDQNRSTTKKIKVKVDIHSRETENKNSNSQKNTDKKSKDKNAKKSKTKTISHVKDSKENPVPKMPSMSFLDNEITSEPYNDDSAIFMSPKPVMPLRGKKIKENTTPIISGNMMKDKRLRSIDCSFNVDNIQSTSTPNPEPNPDSEPIRDKVQELGEPKLTPPVFSPVKQLDTPATSDYGSMVETPSQDMDYREREHSPSPAFSLDDDRGIVYITF